MDNPPERSLPLKGMRILIVEDEILIAADLEDTFLEAGAEVVTASCLAEGLIGAQDVMLNAAVLDVRLGRDSTEAVADVLMRRGIPFLFHSGHTLPDGMREKFADRMMLLKPTRHRVFIEALLEVSRASG